MSTYYFPLVEARPCFSDNLDDKMYYNIYLNQDTYSIQSTILYTYIPGRYGPRHKQIYINYLKKN